MVNGLYSARDGMMLLQTMVDNTTHNLANAQTTGFKKSLMTSMAQVNNQRNDEALLHHDETHRMNENAINWSQGSLVSTDNHLDLALEGNGFFQIETPNGIRYTRSGSFTLNGNSELVTLQGYKVLDDSGNSIRVDSPDLDVSANGDIRANGQNIARLNIVDFEDRNILLREGHNTFVAADEEESAPMPAEGFKVRQGYVEASNVNVVESMVELIRFQRNYELDQKSIHSIDQTLSKAVSEIGQVS